MAEPEIGTQYPETSFFWQALADLRLLLPYCMACSSYFFPPAPGCFRCGAPEPEYREPSGVGTIYSWIVVHRSFEPEFEGEVPYTVAEVKLIEGPRVYARLQGIKFCDIRADIPVRIGVQFRGDTPYLSCEPVGGPSSRIESAT